MTSRKTVVIGAGIGGLVAAVELARGGDSVLVLERAMAPGGKLREVTVAGRQLDAGPTVLTMRSVFEEIFADAGSTLGEFLTLEPLEVLARHAWGSGPNLDLFADSVRSAEAIGEFAGPSEARRFLAFCVRARDIYQSLERSFIRAASPSPVSLVRHAGLRGLRGLARIAPFSTMWDVLGEYFHDPRLRQLFGRYATYCGSSPFQAPATLMLIAHVEQEGVWQVQGGMHQIALALEQLGRLLGVEYRYGEEVRDITVGNGRITGVTLAKNDPIAAQTLVVNADVSALRAGRLGSGVSRAVPVQRGSRSLSAVTWNLVARTSGFPLLHHNVLFSDDYPGEFAALFTRNQLPDQPTVYICAQDRGNREGHDPGMAERLFCLANAPARGDRATFTRAELDRYERHALMIIEKCGLKIESGLDGGVRTTPTEFEALFPATGGALYGQASHGWNASFSRPGSRSNVAGLYLAGGSTHPGAGLPMAALSGQMAARQIFQDRKT